MSPSPSTPRPVDDLLAPFPPTRPGWQFVTLASDSRFLAAKAAEEAAAVKQTVASGKLPAY